MLFLFRRLTGTPLNVGPFLQVNQSLPHSPTSGVTRAANDMKKIPLVFALVLTASASAAGFFVSAGAGADAVVFFGGGGSAA